ncbi:MAG: LPS assembly protein LptD [Candidatus Arsenophonus melophagi]|nr:LPS assembly protein LptD [Candidatus Arsenophonus melophagi]
MKNSYSTLFATMIWITSHSQQTYAALQEQCMLGVPIYTKSVMKGNLKDLPIYITAKDVVAEHHNFIKYKGNVNIQQGNHTLTADEVILTQKSAINQNLVRTILAKGNVHYDDLKIILKGHKVWLNLNNKDTDVETGHYFMVGRQGRGYANKIKLRDESRYSILEQGTFTTCPQGNNSWSVFGSKVILDREEELAKILNARFRIANLPIFYSPYLHFPIGNKRHSGFLFPSSNYSKSSGFNLEIPFYWNIAPNYDWTITPQVIASRGVKLNNEIRYLTIAGSGTIAVDWLKNDRSYIEDKNSGKYPAYNSDNRWLLYWRHSGILDQVWHFNIDYTKVSDSKYFIDFTSKYGKSTDEYITQKLSMSYVKPNWNATLTHKQFQMFIDSQNNKAYKKDPQLDLNYYKHDLGPFNIKIYAQAANITSAAANNPDATRLHIEPELNLPLHYDGASINNTIKVMATYYSQDIPTNLKNSTLKKQVIRILPLITSDAKFVFERRLLINSNYVHTLEPRVQYLYVPYRDQSDINNYDSSLLQVSYNGLFRNRMYSGLDRIASANQLMAGITTRIYDKKLTERFNFSLGHIYYFQHPKIENSDVLIVDKSNSSPLLLVSDAYLRLTDNWQLRCAIQYDKRLGDIAMSNVITEYRIDADRLVQLNYRFVDRDYIQATLKEAAPISQRGISQLGAIISWPLGDHWGLVASFYHDLKKNQSISRLISLQYSTCCWSINMGYERKIMRWTEKNFSINYDNRWSINLELKGLDNNNNSYLRTQDMLTRGL